MSCRAGEGDFCDCESCRMSYADEQDYSYDRNYEQEYIEHCCGSSGHPLGGMASDGKYRCYCGERIFNGLEIAKEIIVQRRAENDAPEGNEK